MDPIQESAASPTDREDSGILLGGGRTPTVSELYDPATGNGLLIPGYPINRPPPSPGRLRSGLIDSGVLPDHPQLRNLIVEMKDFTGDDPIDRIGHGTIVAIELAGSEAASPAIVSAKVTGPDGKIDLEHVIEAVHWMALQGVKIVNMSLGFLGGRARYTKLCEAIAQYATEPDGGIMFVAAAGNFGPNISVYPTACKAPNLISVSAVVDNQLWAQSGRGDIAAEGTVEFLTTHVYHYEAARKLAQAANYGRAREEYLASIAAQTNAPALFGIALLDIHDGKLDPAYTALIQAAPLAPNDAEIEAHLGCVRLMQQRFAEARTHFDRALVLDPKNVRARSNRAATLIQLGEPTQALSDLMEVRLFAEDKSRIDEAIAQLLRDKWAP